MAGIKRLTTRALVTVLGSNVPFVYKDRFLDTVAAGGLNGTNCNPGPGTRTAVDTESKLSSGSGWMTCSGGKATPVEGDPGLWLPARNRVSNSIALFVVKPGATDKQFYIGWDNNAAGTPLDSVTFSTAGRIYPFTGSQGPVIGTYSALQTYQVVILLRPTQGIAAFINGGTYQGFTLLWENTYNTVTNNRPSFANKNAAVDFALMAVPLQTVPFTPIVSSVTEITDVGLADMYVKADVTRSAGNAGMYFRYVDADNHWRAYYDGTNIKVDKVVTGTPTNVLTQAATYSAGAPIRVTCDGNAIEAYYNNTRAQTGASDETFNTATKVGPYSTDGGNTIANFTVWRRKGWSFGKFFRL